jgi:hypothetical protein
MVNEQEFNDRVQSLSFKLKTVSVALGEATNIMQGIITDLLAENRELSKKLSPEPEKKVEPTA